MLLTKPIQTYIQAQISTVLLNRMKIYGNTDIMETYQVIFYYNELRH
jgi:hypothetical protein